MNQERRFSVVRGLEGCLVSGMCWFAMVWFVACISLPLSERSELFTEVFNKTGPVLFAVGWLFAIWLGGYHAARQGKTTGWTNSLVVGLLAECYLVARLPEGTSLRKVMDEPILNWQQLTFLWLTIPAAIVGGIIWEKKCRLDEAAGNEQSGPVNEAGPQEE